MDDIVEIDIENRRLGINIVGPEATFDVNGDIQTNDCYRVKGKEVVDDEKLGDSVTKSNLKELGHLNEINVGNITLNGNALKTTAGSLDLIPAKNTDLNIDIKGGSLVVITEFRRTDKSVPVVKLIQKEHDQPLLAFEGVLEESINKSITSIKEIGIVAGQLLIEVNDKKYYLPYFNEPK